MILLIPNVLNAEQVRQVRETLGQTKFVAQKRGRATSGAETPVADAKIVKNTLQADITSPEYVRLNASLLPVIANNKTLEASALPQKFTKLHFSRYHDNMSYAPHIDAALIGDVRSDVSFTLFLASPANTRAAN